MPADRLTIPLARWADRELAQFAETTGVPAVPRGGTLLGERAALNRFAVPGQRSAGGGCLLLPARNGWIAINLAREDDRSLLPALFETETAIDDEAIALCVAASDADRLVARGREMGLAIAALCEPEAPPAAVEVLQTGTLRSGSLHDRPLVVDLSSLWAGPLASHLLWLAGARVVKVESRSRPDAMRDGDAVLFDLLNQGKASVQADFASVADREALVALLERADIVIEASRPRALRQLGIAAETILSRRPGQVWLTITGHGAQGSPADWVGFGDDCGVAGGLSKALADVTGRPGFVGDAIADPLTGITAALAGWRQWQSGAGARLGIAMRGVVAKALHEEQSHDHVALEDELTGWGAAEGRPFPAVAMRRPMAAVHGLGTDTREWLATC